jgi:hypothetical protein
MDINAVRQEIEKRKSANYTYLMLADKPGNIMDKDNCIIHPQKRVWTKNLEMDMEKALEYMASNPNPSGTCDVVMVQGKKIEETEVETPVLTTLENETPMEPVRTFSQALEDRSKIERLEYMVRERDRKISELEEELEAVYSEINDVETTEMADNTVNLISQIAPLLPALADKYFELQERKIQAMTGQQARPRPQAAQETADEPTTIYEDYGL